MKREKRVVAEEVDERNRNEEGDDEKSFSSGEKCTDENRPLAKAHE